jgi:hypothetical protein
VAGMTLREFSDAVQLRHQTDTTTGATYWVPRERELHS